MLGDDDANVTVLEVATDVGVPRLVVRPARPGYSGAYDGFGDAVVVEPGTAIVTLLEQGVTSPQSAALLLRTDSDRIVSQFRIDDPALDGIRVRDLRLPADLLLLQMTRDGSTVVVSGLTVLRVGDEITVLGSEDGLAEARVRLGV